jgi:hypothetical protein
MQGLITFDTLWLSGLYLPVMTLAKTGYHSKLSSLPGVLELGEAEPRLSLRLRGGKAAASALFYGS